MSSLTLLIPCVQRGVVKEALRLGYGIVSASPRLVPREGAVIGGYHLPRDVSHHPKTIYTILYQANIAVSP